MIILWYYPVHQTAYHMTVLSKMIKCLNPVSFGSIRSTKVTPVPSFCNECDYFCIPMPVGDELVHVITHLCQRDFGDYNNNVPRYEIHITMHQRLLTKLSWDTRYIYLIE